YLLPRHLSSALACSAGLAGLRVIQPLSYAPTRLCSSNLRDLAPHWCCDTDCHESSREGRVAQQGRRERIRGAGVANLSGIVLIFLLSFSQKAAAPALVA